MRIPLGCHFGIWHNWGKWEIEGEILHHTTHLATGIQVETGKSIVQERVCQDCSAIQFRREKR